MKKYLVLLLALFMVFTLQNGVYADDDDHFVVDGFKIDENGEMWYKSLNEVVSTNDTITAAESGKIFLMSGSSSDKIVMTLPAAAAGLTYTFVSIQLDSQKYEINPNGADRLHYSTAAAGNRLVSVGGIGDSVTVYASDDTVWAVNPNVTFTVKSD